MDWEILYYSAEVQETIDAWPLGIRAYYARITERMCAFGPIWECRLRIAWGMGFSKFTKKHGGNWGANAGRGTKTG